MLEDKLKEYDYNLPAELIRKEALTIRDEARLFIYDTSNDIISFDYFYNLDKYLPENSNLILNHTKVKPSRLIYKTERGANVELFLLLNEWDGKSDIRFLYNGKIKWNQDIIIGEYKLDIYKLDDKYYLKNNINIDELLNKYGLTPIPHYLEVGKNKDMRIENALKNEELLRNRYQTVFAKEGKSIAAPTASLHFTKRVFDKLKLKNITNSYINLDVGLGTFALLNEDNLKENKLHTEYYNIDVNTINNIKNNKNIVVGTTSVRAIESYGVNNRVSGSTDIFIHDDFNFKYTDILITNFHLPKSSLMMLVQAFLNHKKSKKTLVQLYEIAIENNFKFYSFGDSMLII